jgi:hypothetical protein
MYMSVRVLALRIILLFSVYVPVRYQGMHPQVPAAVKVPVRIIIYQSREYYWHRLYPYITPEAVACLPGPRAAVFSPFFFFVLLGGLRRYFLYDYTFNPYDLCKQQPTSHVLFAVLLRRVQVHRKQLPVSVDLHLFFMSTSH